MKIIDRILYGFAAIHICGAIILLYGGDWKGALFFAAFAALMYVGAHIK